LSAENVTRKITAGLGLPKEVALNLPLISIYGNEELNIENYKGMVEYSEEKIRLSTTAGVISIKGRKLIIKQITSENVTVRGALTSVEFF
jgi:sporulation protein YqfC